MSSSDFPNRLYHGTTPEGFKGILTTGIVPGEGESCVYLASSEEQAAKYVHHHHAWRQLDGDVVYSYLGEPEPAAEPTRGFVYVIEIDTSHLDHALFERHDIKDSYYLNLPIYTYEGTVPMEAIRTFRKYPIQTIQKP